jgi:hypothetical protein
MADIPFFCGGHAVRSTPLASNGILVFSKSLKIRESDAPKQFNCKQLSLLLRERRLTAIYSRKNALKNQTQTLIP